MSAPTGAVRDTHLAAIQHGLVDLDGSEHLAGVARRSTSGFRAAVDANYPHLGPPEDLLTETQRQQDAMQMQGLCETGAHNAAWETVGFERRYRTYVDGNPEVAATLDSLQARLRDGQDVVFVCFEPENERCHRHLLVEQMDAPR